MWQVITDLVRTGVTVFLTTQYLEEADRLADTIAVINGGVIVAQGTPAALKQQVADQRLELTMVDDAAFDPGSKCPGCRRSHCRHRGLHGQRCDRRHRRQCPTIAGRY